MLRLKIPATVAEELTATKVAVDTAYAKKQDADNRTKLDTIALHEALGEAHKVFRRYLHYYVKYNRAAMPGDFEALYMPVPGRRSSLPAPSDTPGIRSVKSDNWAVTVIFFDAKSNRRAKPDGVRGLEVYYKLDGGEPDGIEQLTAHAIATASPLRLQFEMEDRFKKVYLAFRWLGTRGDYGPWSDLYKVNVSQ